MKIELHEGAIAWQSKARDYAGEFLQPHEFEAELNNGELPDVTTKRNKERALELGFSRIDVPQAWGGKSHRRSRRADIRWPRLYARKRRRTLLP